MEQKKNNLKKCSILKRKKRTRDFEENLDSHFVEYMQKHPELTPEPPSPPPGEFQMIMEELNRRGTKLLVRKQLEMINKCRRMVFYLHKPFMITMMALVIMSAITIDISAERAYASHNNESRYSRVDYSTIQDCQIIIFFETVYHDFLNKDFLNEEHRRSNQYAVCRKKIPTDGTDSGFKP
ncbi:hypothetical protein [Lacrimispora sp. JR3]|uniref:hypothetical protein n=1 Tax=Lacrimispora sinapis TaxID=3111456 RepID=UPI0037493D82